jgi:hypothetical protein
MQYSTFDEPWPVVTTPRNQPPGIRSDRWLFAILLVNAIAVALIALKKLSWSHAPQIGTVLAVVALGLWLGISAARNWHWMLRLFIVALGLGLGAVAWFVVPTTGGLSVWAGQLEAQRLLTELESLPIGDGVHYQENMEARQRLVTQFPQYKDLFQVLDANWNEKSRVQWQTDLDKLAVGDLAGLGNLRRSYEAFLNPGLRAAETAWFERTYRSLAPGDFAAARRLRELTRAREDLVEPARTGEAEWAGRTVAAVLAETSELMAEDPGRASTRLQQAARDLAAFDKYDIPQTNLLTARRQAFRACLEGAQREARTLIEDNRFQALAGVGQRMNQFQEEARAVGAAAELAQFMDSCAFVADLARAAEKADPP